MEILHPRERFFGFCAAMAAPRCPDRIRYWRAMATFMSVALSAMRSPERSKVTRLSVPVKANVVLVVRPVRRGCRRRDRR